MAKLRYLNDGKGKYQSHELYLVDDIEVNSSGSYGEDLADALRYLMSECVEKKTVLDQLISDISSRNLEFVDDEGNSVEKECVTNYYTGNETETEIPFSIKHIPYIEEDVKTKFSRMRQSIKRYSTEDGAGRWGEGRTNDVNRLFDYIIDGFLQIPSMIIVPYNRKLQLTWKTPEGILLVLHITAAKIEFYMSFRNVFSKIPDSFIEVTDLEQVIFILKSFGLYR